MSKHDVERKTRDTRTSREIDSVDQKRVHVTREDIEKFASITKGPLYISEEDKNDPEYHHTWVDATRPARLDKLLDWGAEIVQKYDRNNKLVDDTCHDHGDHLVHIKIPRHVKKMIDDIKRERRLANQGRSFTSEHEISESGSPITTIKNNF